MPRREDLVSGVFIEALCLFGQETGQTECQTSRLVLIVPHPTDQILSIWTVLFSSSVSFSQLIEFANNIEIY